jgi:hypothetical protein
MKSEAELKFIELLKKSSLSIQERNEMDSARKLFVEELKLEIKELSNELKEVGSKYTDPWDMVNTRDSYPEAIDILIKHVSKGYHDKNREGIFRSLTVKEAKGKANDTLIEEYNKISKEKDNLRWVIGNAIYIIVTPKDIEAILSIVENKNNGMSRDMFVLALGKIKSEKAENVLIKLLDDEEISLYALRALRRMESKKAKEKILFLSNSPKEAIKKEAQKALTKIG